MSHVFTNLIDNGIKYSKKGGRISLNLGEEGDNIVFTIEDEGEGMTKEVMDHIFEKFYQGDTSHKSEGNGLGLALCRIILDAAGGDIVVESRPGEGSRFTVTLPKN